MNSARFKKVLVLLVGAAVAAGSAAMRSQAGAQESSSQGSELLSSGTQDAANTFVPFVEEESEPAQPERSAQEGKRVRVGNSEFIFSHYFDFSGAANDLFVWGWLPTISGEISDNAFLGGQKVNLTSDASIGGDLFVFAQNARIEGQVGGDMYVFANDMHIAEGVIVGGAIYGAAVVATFDGDIGGPVSFAGGALLINGTIHGDVRIECGELELGPNAVIEGELRYESPREATIDPGARVIGDIWHDMPREDREDAEAAAAAESGWLNMWSLLWSGWWFLSSFIVGAFALAIGGEKARRPASCLAEQPALGLGFGFVVAVVIPAAAILAMILLVTIPLGMIALMTYFAAAYLARLVAAQTVGDWLLRKARGGVESSAYASLALGLVLFFVLTQIPYVGFLIWLAAVVGGLGGIFLATRAGDGDLVAAAPRPPAAA